MRANSGYTLLHSLESPADLRRLTIRQLPALAAELRSFLQRNVATQAEQKPAGLATVELAIALHYVFDTPSDRIIWDSGQQAWPYKALIGWRGRLLTAGQHGGLQPFPQRDESEHDAFGAGDCSTAIGAALGMTVAAVHLGSRQRVVAVVGNGALSAGMAFEALNHAGSLPTDLLVILNETDPSPSARSRVLSNQLAQVLAGRMYARLRDRGKRVLRQMPTVRELARRSEQHLKGMLLPGSMFEELGFNYIGPLDGHNVAVLVATLRNLQRLSGPQFLHVLTRKPAMPAADPGPQRSEPAVVAVRRPARNVQPGQAATARLGYCEVFGQWLCESAAADPTIIAITPAQTFAGGLYEFARRFPQRCFDVSVAQQHAVTFAAGLATEGFKPIVAISATFLQRAYDQLIHDVALQRLPVMLVVDHAGLADGEGATHHGAYDLSYLRCVPNLTIMAPANDNECRQMLHRAQPSGALRGALCVRPRTGSASGRRHVPTADRACAGVQ